MKYVSSLKEEEVKVAASINVVTMVLLFGFEGVFLGVSRNGVLRIDIEDEE